MTGNLKMIKNSKLRSLLTKGPKYREKERVNWKKVQSCINSGIDDYVNSWAKYENVDIKVLNEWTITLKDSVKKKIERIIKYKKLRGFNFPICLKTLNRTDVKSNLRDLHKNFVLVPTDKAQNNISIICKKFYVDSLLKEVSFSLDSLESKNDGTYITVDDSLDNIITKHIEDVKQWNGVITEKQKQLPFLYWIPKMHKNPSKKRFIAASSSCTTKSTSAMITLCLKLIQKAHQVYCNRIKAYTGFNFMWIIQNSLELQEALQKKARNLATYDFSTLYTSIPHDKLKEKLSQVIIKAFKGMNKKFIKLYNKYAKWSNKKSQNTLDCDTLIKMINWLIDNTYVTIGSSVFKQAIGIPMGTDCAPFLANLFLYSYEFDFLNDTLKQKDLSTLYKFNKCYRYIDDLLAVNNDKTLNDFKGRIYPPELELTCEDKSDQKVNYLDLHLEIKNQCIQYRLYDKRDNFGFSIVNFPDLSGNIPTNQSYGVFISQLIRYARCCQNFVDFKERTSALISRLLKQNFQLVKLRRTFNKFSSKYSHLLKKYKELRTYDLSALL